MPAKCQIKKTVIGRESKMAECYAKENIYKIVRFCINKRSESSGNLATPRVVE